MNSLYFPVLKKTFFETLQRIPGLSSLNLGSLPPQRVGEDCLHPGDRQGGGTEGQAQGFWSPEQGVYRHLLPLSDQP